MKSITIFFAKRELRFKISKKAPENRRRLYFLQKMSLYFAKVLEKFGFYNIVISIKTTNVQEMIAANRYLSAHTSYPLHLGVTEAGSSERGLLRSTLGIGSLLCDGIGDTIRVSLTNDPLQDAPSEAAVTT